MRLEEQVVIVTGAGKGIGRGIAEQFASEGAMVIVATLVPEEGRETESAIRERGGKAIFIETDVSSEVSIIRMMDHTARTCGRIDVLVNNAGITVFKPLLEATVEEWEKVMNIDLRGVFLCSKYAALQMKKQGKGAIINISSNHAKATLPDTEMYAAAKAGVNGMTRSMALSLGKHGIRVNAICPGFTDTPHYRKWLQASGHASVVEEEVLALHAGSRISTPGDIARLAVFLASDEAEMITGTEMLIDGGMSARLYNSRLC
ncbi:SDR family NAD(P)-dependent oxidoreductase [Paenibacillus mucilaginosus]|uniref:Short-chain dehydrogenase/reductase SDR n=1 Tax=Paenibacillus mucilaginosus (strain KNP414) TaxID=1036673 RepID=F8FD54_PAEMK|nr:SDR family oxidoreductase [Paenibacillus mucilaginosus]AEI41714.1 short-chain dehydrogenase/reductase SDR [Paenibacillus mucilaginosus KNP414]MCG7214406.1 SDR family oxidoreductase [Paenibacillus mucilaginosus]WDM30692.1 SDR family oxidoreductase [Paenibacillus mucilaginosus]